MDDLISRQEAIEALCSVCGYDCDKSEFVYDAPQDEQVILCPEHYALTQLPSVQPEQPPYVAEIEAEYQKAVKMPHIHKPLAKALYEVWKKHDREDAERRADGRSDQPAGGD